jgi:hypothetical protein
MSTDDAAPARPLEDGWLPDTPVDDTLLRQFVHNQAHLDAIVALALGGRVEATADVFLADAASPVPYFNQAILARPLRGADDGVLDEVESFFAAGKHPATLLSLWPTPDLSARGWALMGHPAFVARGAAPHDSAPRPGVEVRVADDAGTLAAAERVAIEGYPLEEAAGLSEPNVLPATLLGTGLRVRLGLCDGEPAAVGNVYTGHGVVNLCLGATLPRRPPPGGVGGAGVGPGGRGPGPARRRLHQRLLPARLHPHGLPPHHPLHPVGPLPRFVIGVGGMRWVSGVTPPRS